VRPLPSVEDDAYCDSGTAPPAPPAKRNDQRFQIVLIEQPDATGQRWMAALGLLIEAGRREDGQP
jgi:hypothetical protein